MFAPLFDTPDTSYYMLLGYAFLLGLPILYILSWFVRYRNLAKDREVFKALEQDTDQT
jgi:hypothetical protein